MAQDTIKIPERRIPTALLVTGIIIVLIVALFTYMMTRPSTKLPATSDNPISQAIAAPWGDWRVSYESIRVQGDTLHVKAIFSGMGGTQPTSQSAWDTLGKTIVDELVKVAKMPVSLNLYNHEGDTLMTSHQAR